jgi:hypothetical protein
MDHTDLATFCGRIGNLYGRFGMCPPFALRDAAQGWIARGIPLSHCVDVIERYLDRYGRSCPSGSGDRNFAWLNSLIQTSWYERSFATLPHPAPEEISPHDRIRDYGDDEENRQAGHKTPYSARLACLDSRAAVGALSPATPAKSGSVDQIISSRGSRSRSPGKARARGSKKIDTAVAWLGTELANGERMAAVVEAKARSRGIAPRTLDRARQRLGVTSRRVGFGRNAKYIMALPVVDGTPKASSTDAGAT